MEFDLLTYLAPIVALFFIWKLGAALGSSNDSDEQRNPPPTIINKVAEPPVTPQAAPQAAEPQSESLATNIIKFPERKSAQEKPQEKSLSPEITELIAKLGESHKPALQQIVAQDNNFSPTEFLQGAKIAYEMIVVAFAKGDLPTLENLLDNQLYKNFADIIKQRETNGEKIELRFIGIEKSNITDIKLENNMIHITANFLSQMVRGVYDKENNIIDGDVSVVSEIKDTWVFAKQLTSSDPNWKLFATL